MYRFHNDTNTYFSDAFVLLVTIMSLAAVCCIPVLRVFADTVRQQDDDTAVIVPGDNDRDYGILLSYIFNTAGKQIDDTADDYIRATDDYRARVARGIVENTELVAALYVLTDNFPDGIATTYRGEIHDLERAAERHYLDVIRYVNNDTFLAQAVIDEYALKRYTLFEKITQWLGQATTVSDLSRLRKQSYSLRVAIAKLYEKMESVLKNQTV